MANITAISEIPYGAVGDTCVFGKHQVNSETPWDIDCRIVHQDKETKSLILMANDIIDLRAFDAKEPNNSDNNRRGYGNNQWRYANIRQWLNSDAAAGKWYSAQHNADHQPDTSDGTGGYKTQYFMRPGFLYNFSSETKALLKAGSIISNLPSTDGGGQASTSDSVFLPSWKELNFAAADSDSAEGTVFQYFENAENANRIAHMNATAFANTSSTNKPSTAASPWYYWLRSPNVSRSNAVRFVGADGSLYNNFAYRGFYGVRPCFRIPMQTAVDVVDKFIVLPSASEISYLSPVRTLTGPSKMIVVAIDYVIEGSFVTVQACNNAYDASPTWEDITDYVTANSAVLLKNTTKTADKWGLQVRVRIDKKDAPWISSRGIAYAVLGDDK